MKYIELLDEVERGARFSVDFKKRELKVNGKKIDLVQLEMEDCHKLRKDPLGQISALYSVYKHSVPSERSESRRRNHFKALPEKDLSDSDMMYSPPRETARFTLEASVLLAIAHGWLVWDDETMGKWFWQSPADKDLVILKEWVAGQPKATCYKL